VICFRRIRLTAIDASYRYSRTAKRAGIVTLQLTPVANLGYGATQIEWSSRKEQIAKQKSAYNDLPGRFEVIGVTERSIAGRLPFRCADASKALKPITRSVCMEAEL